MALLGNWLELEEWKVQSLWRIGFRYDTLALSNMAGKEIDESALAKALARVWGRQRITSLVVHFSSKVTDMQFAAGLPNLESLQLFGQKLQTLDGLERCPNVRYISVDTSQNRRRSIQRIAESAVQRLTLHWARPEDLDAVARTKTLQWLDLYSSPKLPLDQWRDLPLTNLGLWRGAIDVLADTAQLPLEKLQLMCCRHLERFAGDNSTVTWALVQDCHRLDWRTIGTFRRLESLWVTGNKSEMPLSAFTQRPALRSLTLTQCKVQLDVLDLKSTAPHLEKLLIGGLRKGQVQELSRANPGVVVTNGNLTFLDGTSST